MILNVKGLFLVKPTNFDFEIGSKNVLSQNNEINTDLGLGGNSTLGVAQGDNVDIESLLDGFGKNIDDISASIGKELASLSPEDSEDLQSTLIKGLDEDIKNGDPNSEITKAQGLLKDKIQQAKGKMSDSEFAGYTAVAIALAPTALRLLRQKTGSVFGFVTAPFRGKNPFSAISNFRSDSSRLGEYLGKKIASYDPNSYVHFRSNVDEFNNLVEEHKKTLQNIVNNESDPYIKKSLTAAASDVDYIDTEKTVKKGWFTKKTKTVGLNDKEILKNIKSTGVIQSNEAALNDLKADAGTIAKGGPEPVRTDLSPKSGYKKASNFRKSDRAAAKVKLGGAKDVEAVEHAIINSSDETLEGLEAVAKSGKYLRLAEGLGKAVPVLNTVINGAIAYQTYKEGKDAYDHGASGGTITAIGVNSAVAISVDSALIAMMAATGPIGWIVGIGAYAGCAIAGVKNPSEYLGELVARKVGRRVDGKQITYFRGSDEHEKAHNPDEHKPDGLDIMAGNSKKPLTAKQIKDANELMFAMIGLNPDGTKHNDALAAVEKITGKKVMQANSKTA